MKSKLLLYIILVYFLSINLIYAQSKMIIGLVDIQLVEINQETGQAKNYLNISGLPAESSLRDLVFNESLNKYYTINSPTDNPILYAISESGEFIESIPLSLSGVEIFTVESITYNFNSEKTYISASINSGVQQNDFYSETILKVDLQTGKCEFVTEISTGINNPDIDAFTMVEDDFFRWGTSISKFHKLLYTKI